jgi:hypothetical protein
VPKNTFTLSVARIALASFIGTAIEFYDFYIYGMAAALVIGPVFFPDSNPATQALSAFLTFAVAFLTRPLGADAVRTFRRPHRAQNNLGRIAAGNGNFHHTDRFVAWL